MNYQTQFGNKMVAALELAFLWLGRDFVRFFTGNGCIDFDFDEIRFHCLHMREKIIGYLNLSY